jgi:hypothetical protein
MDVKTAFLYNSIDEEVYTEQPIGFKQGEKNKDFVCKLNKALYRLKQSPKLWFDTLADFLATIGFQPLVSNACIFSDGKGTFITTFVDDLQLIRPSIETINQLKAALHAKFKIEDLRASSFYLGIELTRDKPNRTLKLNQKAYIERMLDDFNINDYKPAPTPMTTGYSFKKALDSYKASE